MIELARIGSPPLPREHGAWAMLAIPLVLALAASRGVEPAAVTVVLGMLLLFLARQALVPAAARFVEGRQVTPHYLVRRSAWAALYAAGFATSFWMASVQAGTEGRRSLLAAAVPVLLLGAAHAAFGLLGRDRGIFPELLGMAALSSAALLVFAASGHPLDHRAIGVAALAFLYFASSLAVVRAFRRSRQKPGAETAGYALAHAGIAGALVALWAAGSIGLGGLLAFLPVGARSILNRRFPPRNLKELGWREAAVSVVFLLLASVALVTGGFSEPRP